MPIISGGGGGGGGVISGVAVTGAGAAGKVPVASSAAAGAWAFPPGFEIGYTPITANVNIVSTTEATGTTIISPGALTFDGTLVLCEFSGIISVDTALGGDATIISLFEGATQITRLCQFISVSTTTQQSVTVNGKFRFTPTAASHTYTITAFSTSATGTPKVNAGAGSTGGNPPAFVRFTKV
jgi:hypothetical protein